MRSLSVISYYFKLTKNVTALYVFYSYGTSYPCFISLNHWMALCWLWISLQMSQGSITLSKFVHKLVDEQVFMFGTSTVAAWKQENGHAKDMANLMPVNLDARPEHISPPCPLLALGNNNQAQPFEAPNRNSSLLPLFLCNSLSGGWVSVSWICSAFARCM